MATQGMIVPAASRSSGWALWISWVLATALGELIGFAAPALVGTAAYALKLPDSMMVAGLLGAGAIEGAVLGLAQWLVLRRILPELPRRVWVLATAAAAVVAYIIGLIPSQGGDLSRLHPAVLAGGAAMLGTIFVVSIGFAQWLVLRRILPSAGWWILANAVAWPLGVMVPVVGLTLVPDGAPVALMGGVGLASGLLMGVVVGAITGFALAWLVRGRRPRA
jgi:hypothetical protein